MKQSGYLRLTFASLTEDLSLIQLAREEADRILASKEGLLGAEYEAIRSVLSAARPFDAEKSGA